MFRHPLVLLCAVVLGAWTGLIWPQCGALARARGVVGMDPRPVKPDWITLVMATADANTNSALAVYVMLVKDKDKAVLDSLAAMSAA